MKQSITLDALHRDLTALRHEVLEELREIKEAVVPDDETLEESDSNDDELELRPSFVKKIREIERRGKFNHYDSLDDFERAIRNRA